ncbi:CRAL-TRIO domain-containing protein [Madurella fahalii]|uniref:CRAL-TRIO domain-containing protein n=1 Tax=Madurella fahalii TaxID=1157608 RepID=A0ABQ0FWE3_9PEZI
MPDWPFSRVTTELLAILRDRYPSGLTTSNPRAPITTIPAGDRDVKMAYALPKNPNDLSEGWKNLKTQTTDTVADKEVTDMCALAFALLDPDMDESDAEFDVECPMLGGEEQP